jgi:4-hydroxyphenylacetate 3-monooxygenase
MTAYPRMVEILQLLGSSSFMIIPSEADFHSPLAPDIEQYLATETTTARDRVKLFRLAWDIAGSAFGSRQVLYERFFASDPLTRARTLNAIYPKEEVMERIRDFLGREEALGASVTAPGSAAALRSAHGSGGEGPTGRPSAHPVAEENA